LKTVNSTGVTTTLALTTDYTVSGVGVAGGGNITLVTGASVNDVITVTGATPLARTTDFSQAGDFLASDLNTQLDNHPRWSGAGVWDSFKSGFTQVGNAIAPVAKEIFHDVVVPESKEYVKDQIKEYKSGKGGSKISALIAKMIGNQRKSFNIDRVSKPSGNAISYAKKAFGQTYKGKKPSDMWNTYQGEIKAQEAPKKRGRTPKAPVAPDEDVPF
jgi:hypothetical protein